jgi:hypothetical protein
VTWGRCDLVCARGIWYGPPATSWLLLSNACAASTRAACNVPTAPHASRCPPTRPRPSVPCPPMMQLQRPSLACASRRGLGCAPLASHRSASSSGRPCQQAGKQPQPQHQQQHHHHHQHASVVVCAAGPDIENLSTDYCDDFECTSSPAVEQTVRSMAQDLLRVRYSKRLFQTDVQYQVRGQRCTRAATTQAAGLRNEAGMAHDVCVARTVGGTWRLPQALPVPGPAALLPGAQPRSRALRKLLQDGYRSFSGADKFTRATWAEESLTNRSAVGATPPPPPPLHSPWPAPCPPREGQGQGGNYRLQAPGHAPKRRVALRRRPADEPAPPRRPAGHQAHPDAGQGHGADRLAAVWQPGRGVCGAADGDHPQHEPAHGAGRLPQRADGPQQVGGSCFRSCRCGPWCTLAWRAPWRGAASGTHAAAHRLAQQDAVCLGPRGGEGTGGWRLAAQQAAVWAHGSCSRLLQAGPRLKPGGLSLRAGAGATRAPPWRCAPARRRGPPSSRPWTPARGSTASRTRSPRWAPWRRTSRCTRTRRTPPR